jgi:hypothetical protein
MIWFNYLIHNKMRDLITKTVNVALVLSIILMFLAIGYTVARTVIASDQVKDLNNRYVFIYPHPSELPEGVDLCVDVVVPGNTRDTVWLMPDHESAGY